MTLLPANRTLEDMDAYYRDNPALIVTTDSEAVSVKRPLRFIQHEDEELQRTAKSEGERRGEVVQEG